ncbi:uncharacterized protein LOC110428147 [Herrania umbratica]|uniref:Uncharacterized protein LOC110428147 n=1 Tax=Herrania umbratica TaxID=108875 RepID=A0A6J1BIY7_9ROSI|nr:uncharacterized protein LOC110428147 [Herrania umbratica]
MGPRKRKNFFFEEITRFHKRNLFSPYRKTPNFAELQAIHQGLDFFFASPWTSNHQLEAESDSTNAILWVKDNTKVPWKMKFNSNAIETLIGNNIGITFKHIRREANAVADGLAKAGVIRDINHSADFELTEA